MSVFKDKVLLITGGTGSFPNKVQEVRSRVGWKITQPSDISL